MTHQPNLQFQDLESVSNWLSNEGKVSIKLLKMLFFLGFDGLDGSNNLTKQTLKMLCFLFIRFWIKAHREKHTQQQ